MSKDNRHRSDSEKKPKNPKANPDKQKHKIDWIENERIERELENEQDAEM